MTRQALLAELDAARQDLYRALRDLPPDELVRPGAVGEQSIAELCGHLSGWENRLLTVLQQLSQGDPVRGEDALLAGQGGRFCADAFEDNQRFNQLQRRKRARWPWREVLNELVWLREETGATLAALSEGDLYRLRSLETGDGAVQICPGDIVAQLANHDRLHTREILDWRREEELR